MPNIFGFTVFSWSFVLYQSLISRQWRWFTVICSQQWMDLLVLASQHFDVVLFLLNKQQVLLATFWPEILRSMKVLGMVWLNPTCSIRMQIWVWKSEFLVALAFWPPKVMFNSTSHTSTCVYPIIWPSCFVCIDCAPVFSHVYHLMCNFTAKIWNLHSFSSCTVLNCTEDLLLATAKSEKRKA